MANLALYRKYRPQTFSEIIAQKHIVKILTNAIASDMISHAYLFSGSRGTGKTTMGRLFAKAINCKNRKKGEYEPCNKCESCLEINKGNSMDLIEIDAASNRGIDDIRELKETIRFVPNKSKYKVFIIDECLTENHFITLADGRIKKISEIKNGEKIASIDIKTGNIVSGKVKNWFKRETNQIVEIKTPQAFLKCTPTHKLWVSRDSKFILIETKNLKVGDFLLSPIYSPHIQTNNLTPAQLSLLALIQCDGHVSKDSMTIQIEIQKDKDYFKKVFKEGLKAWKIKEKPVIKQTSRGTRLIRVYSKKLKDTLIKLDCPQGKKGKKIDIPDVVFQAPLKSVKSYINTCFCCEGNVDFDKTRNLYRLHFNSSSEIFTRKLQILLKKFGISTSFLKILKENKNKNHSNQYRLCLSHYNLKIFYKKIGLSLQRKAKLLLECSLEKERQDTIPIEKIIFEKQKEIKLPYSLRVSLGIYPDLKQHLSRRTVTNFIKAGNLPELNKYLQFRYEKIKKIKILNRKEQVYDFTVENSHTFIANGICSSNCHQLTKEASNALLKILEEPPAHAIFILATTEIQKMISTIISRCQGFSFYKLTVQEIVERLKIILEKEKIKYEEPALFLIAAEATGSIRDAESLLDKIISFSGPGKIIEKQTIIKILGNVENEVIIKFIGYLLEKDTKNAISFLNESIDKGVDVQQFIKVLNNYLREILLLKIDAKFEDSLTLVLSKEEREKIIEFAEKFSSEKIHECLQEFINAESKIRYSSIPQLPIELAIVELCQKK